MKRQSLITVIVPFYNAEKYVTEAVTSIKQQDYQPLEIIAIDDGSTDDSAKIIRSLDKQIRIFSQPNQGPAAARNNGLVHAQGQFIAFLDADDRWPDNKLSLQHSFIMAHPEIEIVWGRVQYFGDFSEREEKIPFEKGQTAIGYQLGSGLFRRTVFDKVGLFDEEFRYSEDYDWLLRAREMGVSFAFQDKIALFYRLHGDSMTHARHNMNYQFPLLLKKSLDRRRRAGEVKVLPKLPKADTTNIQ